MWNCVILIRDAMRKFDAKGKAIQISKLDWQTVGDRAIRSVQVRDSRRACILHAGSISVSLVSALSRNFNPPRSPNYLSWSFSLANALDRGSKKPSTSSRRSRFCKLTFEILVYSQYDANHSTISQSTMPTASSVRARTPKLLRSAGAKETG